MKVSKTFETLGAFLDHVDNEAETLNGEHLHSRETHRPEWFGGTTDFAEAMAMAREGWAPGGAQLGAMLDGIAMTVRQTTALVPRFKRAIHGKRVNIGRYVAGDPECMTSLRLEPGPKFSNLVVLVVNTGALGDVSSETIFERGAAVCAVVEILTELGLNVELWAGAGVRTFPDDGSHWQTLVCVKPATDPMDLNAVAFALAHPAWHRRMMFSCRENESRSVRRKFGFAYSSQKTGYGQTTGLDLSEMDATVSIPNVTPRGQYGVEWVLKTLEQCGIEVHR